MNANEAKDGARALTFWTSRYDVDDDNPNPHPDMTALHCSRVQRMSSGGILIRDVPAKGPDGLPLLLRHAIIERASTFYVVTVGRSPLPIFETNAADLAMADWLANESRVALGGGNRARPAVAALIYTGPTEAARWLATIQSHKPQAVLHRAEGREDLVGLHCPPQGAPSPGSAGQEVVS